MTSEGLPNLIEDSSMVKRVCNAPLGQNGISLVPKMVPGNGCNLVEVCNISVVTLI